MKKIELYSDGACSGNPGPGGYGVILKYKDITKELSGGAPETTNNRMELTAVITGLKALKEPCEVDIYSDSKYIIDAVTKGWAVSWQANNWIKSDKKKALNSDLWEQLLALLQIHNVRFHWVKGHAGHVENERCDELAVEQSKLFANKLL
ncbi:MAG: ribonuclease HI [Ruminococcus sp.]|nr:ribonuclease HI [Ruminococcus sp.]